MAAITNNSSDIMNKCYSYEEELPRELWIEIFIRSSVESLLRVKCVCKRWHALVSNPSFTKAHLQFQKAMSKDKGRFLLTHCENNIISHLLFDKESVASAATSAPSYTILHSFSQMINDSLPLAYIEGPINGLYCVHNGEDRFVIWNPSTKEVGFLPFLEEFLPAGVHESDDPSYVRVRVAVGFGTDPLNEEDYKVVAICSYMKGYPNFGKCCMLYTTCTNTWRLIVEGDEFVGSYFLHGYTLCNTFVDGFFYWLAEYGRSVIAFDMSKEVFRVISTPEMSSENTIRNVNLALHDDCITLFNVNKNMSNIDVWKLMVKESIWIEKNPINGIQGVNKSLGVWKNEDELLLLIDEPDSEEHYCESQMVLYYTTTREITKLGPRGWTDLFKASVYYESLVSLGGEITKYKETSLHKVKLNFLVT